MNLIKSTIAYPLSIPGMEEKRIIRSEGSRSRWIRIVLFWDEIHSKNPLKIIHHQYAAVVDCKSDKKNIYNDDSKIILAYKFAGIALFSPLYNLIKTIYHLIFPLSIGIEIHEELKRIKIAEKSALTQLPLRQLTKRITVVVLNNFLNVIKTPMIAIALTVVCISFLIFSAFNSEMLYYGRIAVGKLSKENLWGREKSDHNFPCMSPIGNLTTISKRKYIEPDTMYEADPGTQLHGLNNLARSHISHLEGVESKPYISDFLKN